MECTFDKQQLLYLPKNVNEPKILYWFTDKIPIELCIVEFSKYRWNKNYSVINTFIHEYFPCKRTQINDKFIAEPMKH